MKPLIIQIVLLLTTTTFSEPLATFFFPEIHFYDLKKQFINNKIALKMLNISRTDSTFFKNCDIKTPSNKFFLADINNDKIQELFFNGNGEGEGRGTIIWKNLKGKYHCVGTIGDSIIGVSDAGNNSLFISTLSSGCCGDIFDYAELYKTSKDTILSSRTVSIYGLIKIPSYKHIFKNIRIKNPVYFLRAQPTISNDIDSEDYKVYGIKGNVLAEIHKGTNAIATASERDSTGRIWWFVIINKPDTSGYGIYSPRSNQFAGNMQFTNEICGWISTKLLDFDLINTKGN